MDKHLRHRINAGRVALKNQIGFFRRQFGQVTSEWKHDETRVTFADFAISEKILADLRASFPHDDICSEEGNPEDEHQSLKATYAWVLDPIDGTNNYVVGLPACAISLALLRHGEPVYGFVYDFSRDSLVQGGPGYGLFDGCQKVVLDGEEAHASHLIGMHFPLGEEGEALAPLLREYRIRSLGSSTLSLTYVALGKFLGVVDYRVKVWDIAAAVALCRAVQIEVHFPEAPPFPLKTFHVQGPRTPVVAGSKAFCRQVLEFIGKNAVHA